MTLKSLFVTAAVSVLAGLPAASWAQAGRLAMLRHEFAPSSAADRPVLVVAHRGCWTETAENSLAAIEACIALGVDVVELDARRTADGALVNVGAYSPPETGEGIPDVRADIYSLGCVFYHLLTGKPPFIGRDPLDYLHQHRTAPVWPVADLVPEIPSAISQVVAMMLEKSLSARLQKPTDLIALLDAAISPEVLGAKGLRPDTTMVSSTMEMLALRDKMTALVCDDQEYTLSLLQAMLRRLGVKVLVARTGRAAVSALEERREINMVVTDLKVPQLWGCHLLDAITNVRPELPILLTRGGEEAERIVNSNCYRVMQYFDRPLDVFALRSAVSSLET